jgi:putative copper resistance protein D
VIEAGIIVSRFPHYSAVLVLFGLTLFPLYAHPDRIARNSVQSDLWLQRAVLWAAIVALLSSLPWLAFTAANMAGDIGASLDWNTLESVLLGTTFGYVWLARNALALLVVGVTAGGRAQGWLLALLAAVLLAGLAGIGHTNQSEGTAVVIHTGADALHLLAAGAWIGGLLALSHSLIHTRGDEEQVLSQFSGMGYVAVAVLLATGLVNGWYLVGTFDALMSTPYGRLLLVKLCLFAGMLGLAVANRFWLVPSLARSGVTDRHNALVRLRRHVIAEETLGLLIIVVVSALGTMEPATTQTI